MKHARRTTVLVLAAALLSAPGAWAGSSVPVNGSGLQDTLDGVTSCDTSTCVSATGNQTISPQWLIIGDPTSQSTILAEIAGYAGQNTFGIYNPNSPPTAKDLMSGMSGSNFLQIYDGANSPGDHAILQYDPNTGAFDVTRYLADGTPDGSASAVFSSGEVFGFYLYGPGGLFFSDPSLNETGTNFPNGTPHMLAYQGGPGLNVKLPPDNQLVPFTANDFIMAWEDLPNGVSDFDYNDFIVLVNNVRPVPEPPGLAWFGIGLLLIGGFAVRQRRLATQHEA